MNLMELIKIEKAFFADTACGMNTFTADQIDFFRNETVHKRRERLSSEMYDRLLGCVTYGPFKGLRLDPDPIWGKADLASQLIGCYELEIIDALHDQEFSDRSHFVDIGAADGYYAIGGLVNNRFKTADCIEISSLACNRIEENAERNGVSDKLRVFLGDANSRFISTLSGINWMNAVVLCDIEGAEFDLFDGKCLDVMYGAMIIMEIHNWVYDFWPRYESLLERAMKKYHLRFLERSRLPTYHIPELRGMPDDNRMLIMSEGRPNVMRFLQLISK